MTKKAVIINQDSGYLATDIANEYANIYDEVVLICGRLNRHERKLNDKIKVEYICPYNRNSIIKRLGAWTKASCQIFHKLLFHYKGYDIVYFSNPPLACFCSMLLKNKFKVIEFDVYPDALISIGVSKNNLIYKTWAYYKQKLFRKADHIYTLSEGMKSVIAQYVDSSKITYVPLWSASSKFKPLDKDKNDFIKQNGFENKFIVMYSGNIGHTHNVECLIEVAKQLRDKDDILFLIVGDGKKKAELITTVETEQLRNVTFMPYQKIEMLPYSLSSADIGVITLDETVSKASVPSKTFNLLAVGAPLLVIASEDAEINRLIKQYDCGKTIDKHNIGEMAEYIIELKNDSTKRSKLQNNAIKASEDFTFKNAKLYL